MVLASLPLWALCILLMFCELWISLFVCIVIVSTNQTGGCICCSGQPQWRKRCSLLWHCQCQVHARLQLQWCNIVWMCSWWAYLLWVYLLYLLWMYLVYLLRVYLLPMSSSRQTATPPIYHNKKKNTTQKQNEPSDIGNVKF